MNSEASVHDLKTYVRGFVIKRGWLKYHNPKDLAEAVCIKAA